MSQGAGASRPLPGAANTDGPASEGPVEITLVLRPRPDAAAPDSQALGLISPRLRSHLSLEQLAQARAAHPEEVLQVLRWAEEQGLQLLESSAATRLVRLAGSLPAIGAALSVELLRESPGGPLVLQDTPRLPAELQEKVVAVLGLDTRPVATPHFRRLSSLPPGVPLAQAAPGSFEIPQVAELYAFPAAQASSHCIGLIELGGGYQQSDIEAYFQQLGVAEPEVTAVSVGGAANQPTGNPDGPDGEVTLDIEMAGACAPGVRIAVYFTTNTDQGFLQAISQAIHDQVNRPAVISISWGGPESSWPTATMTAFDQAFEDAALLGITVCVASGDHGSGDGVGDGLAHVDFPASSPHVLGCGGTSLTASGGEITGEVVWNDGPGGGASGGGVSAFFPLPTWQSGAHVPVSVDPGHGVGRGVPDVAGDANPQTGYQLLVDGQPGVFGGTSAVAPLWAALLTLCGQQLGRPVGYLNPWLYQTLEPEGVTHDITQGNNGAYRAGPGWSACTGWGSPDGARLLQALLGSPASE